MWEWIVDRFRQALAVLAAFGLSLALVGCDQACYSRTPTLSAPPQTQAPTITDGMAAHARGDYVRAKEILEPLAAAGNRTAGYTVGMMHLRGLGYEKYSAAALRLLEEVASEVPAAWATVGSIYAQGRGVPRDLPRAFELYKRGAAQGDKTAQTLLGHMHLSGIATKVDRAEAARWFERVAAQGDGDAQFALAEIHEKGEGVARDLDRAAKLYEQAARNEVAEAPGRLARVRTTIKQEKEAAWRKLGARGLFVAANDAERAGDREGAAERYRFLIRTFSTSPEAPRATDRLNGLEQMAKLEARLAESRRQLLQATGQINELGAAIGDLRNALSLTRQDLAQERRRANVAISSLEYDNRKLESRFRDCASAVRSKDKKK